MENAAGTILYFGVIVVIFYLLIIRPQTRQRREHAQLIDSLVAGDHVITAGGLYGTIKAVTEDSVDLEISSDVIVTVARQAVSKKAEG